MLYEFAVDPHCLNEWDTFIRLIEQFGIPYGRLISQFPKAWPRMVHEACRDFTFCHRQIMGDKLANLKRLALVRCGRPYDGSRAWKENAVEQQRSFHAIITESNEENLHFILIAKDIIAETPLWYVRREDKIPRTVDDLSAAISPLLKMSNRILFVDKKFEPATPRWQETLRRFIEISLDGRVGTVCFEYHLQYDYRNPMTKDEFQEYCERNLSKIIPAGSEMYLSRWDSIPQGEGIHARYVLTERGGVRIDWGLDTGRGGQTTDVTLMDDCLWKQRWEEYHEPSKTFDLIDKITISGKA